MSRKQEFTLPVEQRSIMNAGHGPPTRHPYGNQLPIATHDYRGHGLDWQNTARDLNHAGGRSPFAILPGMTRGLDDTKDQRSHPPWPLEKTDNTAVLMEAIKKKDFQIRVLGQKLEELWAIYRRTRSDDVKEDEDLQRQVLEELRAISRRWNECFPIDASRNQSSRNRDDGLLDLIPTEGRGLLGGVGRRDEDEMMKSVECSEASVDEGGDVNKDQGGEGNRSDFQEVERGISPPSSGQSFEVVGHGSNPQSSLERSPADEVLQQVPKHDTTIHTTRQLQCLRSEVENLKLRGDKLGRRLEAEIEARTRERDQLQRQLKEVNENQLKDGERRERQMRDAERERDELRKRLKEADQREEAERNTGGLKEAEVAAPNSRDERLSEVLRLRRTVNDLEAANWKLSEQKLEVMKENDELRKMEREERSRPVPGDVIKIREELTVKTRQISGLEDELQLERRRLVQLESTMKDLENMLHRLQSEKKQEGTVLSADLSTENALLKHQIDLYREDFDVERKDREKIVAETEKLRRYHDTLQCDMMVARKQVEKFQDDLTLLITDNSALTTKFRQVTEELSGLKGLEPSKEPSAPGLAAFCVATPEGDTTARPGGPTPNAASASAGRLIDWACKVCTFKNPGRRICCDMCGTREPSRTSAAAAAATTPGLLETGCSFAPANPLHRDASSTSPLGNYADIESD